MKEVLEFLEGLITRVNLLQGRLRDDLRGSEDDVRLLGIAQTQAMQALEVLDCYSGARLLHSTTDLGPERIDREIRDRIVATLRQQFITTMSAIEYCAKEAVRMVPNSPIAIAIANLKKKRIYLSDIVLQSQKEEVGLIS